MGKWKDAFLRSLDAEYETPDSFEFGAPATVAELAALSAAVSAKLPRDLFDLLREFNGIKRVGGDEKEPYFFDSHEIPSAGEYYRNWDCDTTLVMEWFKNVAFVCQQNGYSAMWGVVVKPFATYKYGEIVSFDHDRIMFAETESDLFTVNYQSLLQLVEARFKNAG
jgi:hypothetical protein